MVIQSIRKTRSYNIIDNYIKKYQINIKIKFVFISMDTHHIYLKAYKTNLNYNKII